MKYEGRGFNEKWAASKTQKEFVEHEKHTGLTEAQLKEVHSLCVKKVKGESKLAVKPEHN